jgi:hypothetical protein
MIPSENEIQVAMEAAAKRAWDETRTEELANGILLPTWEELDQYNRNICLDTVNPIVWAALTALPDRLQIIRDLLVTGPSPMQFITDVRRWLA